MRKFRKGARFIGDPAQISQSMTRDDCAVILVQARSLENSTRPKDCQNGVLGRPALVVLETLMRKFLCLKTGSCFPSVKKLMGAMKVHYSRKTVFSAFKRLEKAGIMRRIARCKWAVRSDGVKTVVQSSNAYQFSRPKRNAHLIPLPAKKNATTTRVLNLLGTLGKAWTRPVGKSGCKSRPGPEGTLEDLFLRVGMVQESGAR